MLSMTHVGVALSLLAAIACALQPGGRKPRFTGPCGKVLCNCPESVKQAYAAALAATAERAAGETSKKSSPADVSRNPLSAWLLTLGGAHNCGTCRFVIQGADDEQKNLLTDSMHLVAPAPTACVQSDRALQPPVQARDLRYSEPLAGIVAPPPKSLRA
jgi:hypothetical protein